MQNTMQALSSRSHTNHVIDVEQIIADLQPKLDKKKFKKLVILSTIQNKYL